MMSSKPFVVLLVLVAVVGVAVSLAAWCFLELIHQIQQEVFVHLPHAFGYSSEPRWWPLPVLPIEASGIGGARLPLLLVPGLLAAGIGSLVSLGMGSFTGLSTSAYSLSALSLPNFARPTAGNFAWSIALAIAIAVGAHVIMRGGKETYRFVSPRRCQCSRSSAW